MNLKDLKELIDLLRGTELTEIEIQEGDVRIRVRRNEQSSLPPPSAPAPRTGQAPRAEREAASEQPVPMGEEEKFFQVRSPIVGTYYRSPSPDQDPYVDLGDTVKKGQVLCIIEAMKLMNEIESEVDGRVVEICVEDSSAVEYGQTLFKIEPLHKPA